MRNICEQRGAIYAKKFQTAVGTAFEAIRESRHSAWINIYGGMQLAAVMSPPPKKNQRGHCNTGVVLVLY